jgi:uroporphyrinogen decarboxylase
MDKRAVIRTVLQGGRPPYVPWEFGFTKEAREKLEGHFGPGRLADALQCHMMGVGAHEQLMEDAGNDHVRDIFGVTWDRSVDKDIGTPVGLVLPEPSLRGFSMPLDAHRKVFNGMDKALADRPDLFRLFAFGFSLYERAWTLRGMENLMLDFIEHPDFVHELFEVITDHNVAIIKEAVTYDIDAVIFGDDWGQQHGLQMGPRLWREFIKPCLKRMYSTVRDAGKFVMIHSCGDVDELFDDLVEMGLNCFNPFQPEVMDVEALIKQYRGRLAFNGGLSLQKTLPFGTPDDVRNETRWLIELGREGGYILSPSHAVEGDVPLENMLAFIDEVKKQPGWIAANS